MTITPAPTKQTGVSLTQDAWRRLKRSRPAMVALWTLVSVVLLAFFTPLLPLQPPDRDLTSKKFAEPALAPLLEKSFAFDTEIIAKTNERLPAAYERLSEARAALTEANSKDASEEELEAAFRETAQARAAVDALVQRAYGEVGFPKLGPLARWMVRTRLRT
jgi:oligopeptide transport system permease protein